MDKSAGWPYLNLNRGDRRMGRGSGVRAASESSIEITFEYRNVRCREKLKLTPNAANLKYAGNLKGAIENDIAIGTFDYGKYFPRSKRAKLFAKIPATVITAGVLFTEWLASVHKKLEPETYDLYERYVRTTWRPRFGKDLLVNLTAARLEEWIGEQTTTRKRILNLLTPLRQAMRFAVHPKKYLTINPIATLKIERPAGIKKSPIDPFSTSEIDAILAQLAPPLANMVQFWVWTGLRVGEVIALTWNDIDFERGVANINKSARGRRRKGPKTEAGLRDVKLLPPALEALGRQKALTRLLHREIFLDPGAPVRYRDAEGKWHTPTGENIARKAETVNQPWKSDKDIRKWWRKACVAAGVRYRFPRQLRHTYASWMLKFREEPLWISGQMGHSDVSETLETYVKYIPSMSPDAGMGAYAAIMATKKGRD
jgi:integrase